MMQQTKSIWMFTVRLHLILTFLSTCISATKNGNAVIADSKETCSLSLQIPKEHLNLNCVNEHVKKVQRSLEMQMRELKDELTSVKDKQKWFPYFQQSEDLLRIEQRISMLEDRSSEIGVKVADIKEDVKEVRETQSDQSRQGDLEYDLKLTDLFNRKKLYKILKPFFVADLENYKDELKRELYESLKGEIKQEIVNELFNEYEQDGKTYTVIRIDNTDDYYDVSEGKKASDVKGVQADQRFRRRPFQTAIHKLQSETDRKLQDHTEKLKGVVRNHGERVEQEIVNLNEQVNKLENHFNATVNKIQDSFDGLNVGLVMKALRNDVDRIGAGYENLYTRLIAKEDIQTHIHAERENIVNIVTDKVMQPTGAIQVELDKVHKRIGEVHEVHSKNQDILQKSLQNRMAELVEQMHFIERNITHLSNHYENLTESSTNEKKSSKDDCKETKELDKEIIDFIENLKVVVPEVISNLSIIEKQHGAGINTINETVYHLKNCSTCQEFHKQYDQSMSEIQVDVDNTKNTISLIQTDIQHALKKVSDFQHDITESYDVMSYFKSNLAELSTKVEALELAESKRVIKKDGWVKYDFQHTSRRNGCKNGEKYVKETGYETGKYVGVALCSATRYKIYLSDDIGDTFLDIGDSNNMGQDHCEFVGAPEHTEPKIGNNYHFYRIKGYTRADWGQTPRLGMLSFYKPSPLWYECGVSIP